MTLKSSAPRAVNVKRSGKYIVPDKHDVLDAEVSARSYPSRTLVQAQTLQSLHEVYPSLPLDVLEDVLESTQWQADDAAVMLSDLASTVKPPLEIMTREEELNQSIVSDEDVEEGWEEVRPGQPDAWIMVQDEWEDVGMQKSDKQSPTFAEVLRHHATQQRESVHAAQHRLMTPPMWTSMAKEKKEIELREMTSVHTPDVYDLKAVGQRRRRMQKLHASNRRKR